jgi:hypothetical protein
MEQKLNNDIQPIDAVSRPTRINPMLNAVLFKQVTYKITILKCDDASLIPVELRKDFEDWIKMKAVELGLGTHCENYYAHDETSKTFVAVDFSVHCI